MNYQVLDNKLLLRVDDIEAGYIEFNRTNDGLNVEQTYVFPGFRENGYAKAMVEYFLSNAPAKIEQINCAYFRIFANEYKKNK